LNIAQSYEATGDYASAIKYYLETLKISKISIDAYVGLGNCYARINDYQKMLKSFSMIIKYSLLEHFNSEFENRSRNYINTISKKIDELVKTSNSSDELFTLADSYFEVGKWNEAYKTYFKTLNLNLDKSDSYYEMALCLLMLNQNEKALDYLLESFELNPRSEDRFLEEFPYFESTYLYVSLTGSI
jgi:tetratricopeptide (TPR) repeat protein